MAGSSSPQTRQSVFSLDSQAGVMQLLASIRASELTPQIKNELRDLVFLYTNGGHDESVKIALEKKLSDHNVTAIATKNPTQVSEPPREKPTIGTFRTAPSFRVAEVAETESTTAEPKLQTEKAPQPQTEMPTKKPVDPVSTTAEVEVKAYDTPAAPTTAAQPEPAASLTPAHTTIDTATLDRIKAIKAEVNEKVGNPVQLVDRNPELGREYMSALLEAMKKVNSGSRAGEAMARLEKARDTILELDTSGVSQAEPAQTPSVLNSEPANESHAEDKQSQEKSGVVDVKGASLRAGILDDEPTLPTPPIQKVEPKQVPPQRPFTPPVVDTPSYHETSTPAQVNPVPVSQSPEGESSQVPIKSSPRPTFATESKTDPTTRSVAAPAGVPAPPKQPPVSPISSLSNPLIKGQSGKEATSSGTDPLMTPEVDAGLNQLLEEWPIFKKSGLFGTGPKGREHPLFKKIAGLQIPLLLAGRFEGATQEIKQSITDYMNGWRYEQGLIYEQGETFEHYLRRVIRHILDLQKNRL